MTWVAAAIGGGALLGAGGGIAGGIIGSNAAKRAAGQQESGLYMALGQQQNTQNTLLNYFDPFRSMGLQAGQSLTGELYSPQQQTQQAQSSIDQLNLKLKELVRQGKGLTTGQGVPFMQGADASERRKVVWDQMAQQNQKQIAEVQQQIAAQQAQLKNAQAQAANPQSQADLITGNPMYTAASNAASRQLAAQGLQGSQEAIRQEGTLASDVYQKQVANQLGIYQPTVGATENVAGMIGNLGQAQAQTLGDIGHAQAQGTTGAANAWSGAVSGAANSAIGGGSALLNYSLYSKLIGNMNTGGANTGAGGGGWDPVMGTGVRPSGAGPDQDASLRSSWGMGS